MKSIIGLIRERVLHFVEFKFSTKSNFLSTELETTKDLMIECIELERHRLFAIFIAIYELVSAQNQTFSYGDKGDAFLFQVRSTFLLIMAYLVVYDLKTFAYLLGIDIEKMELQVKEPDAAVKFVLGSFFVLWLSTALLLYGVCKKSYKCVFIFVFAFVAQFAVFVHWLNPKDIYENLPEHSLENVNIKRLAVSGLLAFWDVVAWLQLIMFGRRLYVESFEPEAYFGYSKKN